MLAHREKRERPTRDDKVLASWNGLLLGALADAGRALGEPSWVDAARRGFDAVAEKLVRGGRVGRYFKDGVVASPKPGFLDDQAYLGNAALDLFEATGEPRCIGAAHAICAAMVEHHWDRGEGGFWFSPDDGDALITRTKDAYDQAIPSAAAMAALLCLRVGSLIDEALFAPGEKQLELLAGSAMETSMGMSQTLLALDRLVRGGTDVVLVGPLDAPATRALADVAFRRYVPNRSVVHVDPSRPDSSPPPRSPRSARAASPARRWPTCAAGAPARRRCATPPPSRRSSPTRRSTPAEIASLERGSILGARPIAPRPERSSVAHGGVAPPSPPPSGFAGSTLLTMWNSTRRLRCRPSAVVLSAMGRLGP